MATRQVGYQTESIEIGLKCFCKLAMISMKYIGIDGCKIGWFYVALSHEEQWQIGVSESISKLWETFKDISLILIDIPIGLPYEKSRACDIEARRLLGKGNQASLEYLRMIDPSISPEEKERIKKELFIYCGYDTLAMVKIREELIKRC